MPPEPVDAVPEVREEQLKPVSSLRELSERERGVQRRLYWQEVARSQVALFLVAILFMAVVLAFLKVTNWEETKELIQIVLPVLTTLLGSAIGFYFGNKAS